MCWRVFAALVTCLSLAGIACAGAAEWPHATYYTVVARPGDTIGALAARYRVSAGQITDLNHLASENRLRAGEVLRIPAGSDQTRRVVMAEAVDTHAPSFAAPPKRFDGREPNLSRPNRAPVPAFLWPLTGEVLQPFGPAGHGERNDGINIAAGSGAPIRAAADGTVTYAGDALKDYGNLILIAHPDGFVSAYAHAKTILVSRGDRVRRGDVIATAGDTGGAVRPQLHFEIRAGTKPLDPLPLLASR